MKNSLIKAILFTCIGIVLFILSMVSHNPTVEKWSSFALGLSFPLFITGVIAWVYYIRKSRRATGNE